MSETFLRVDLRDGVQGRAHDFRKVALQPGLPLLDPSNTNYRTLRKWFGINVAQPEFCPDWPDSVGFCICDEQNRRIVSAKCEPLSENDLKSQPELARQFEELKTKIQTLQPDNQKESTLLNAVRNHFNNLTTNPSNFGFSFFKYKNGSHWQLIWLWGFERRDYKPATPVICKRDGCRHLIANRVNETSSCPVCQGPPMPFTKNRESRGCSRLLLLPLLLLAILAGGFFAFIKYFDFFLNKGNANYVVRTVPDLEKPWKIPIGGRLKYQIVQVDGDKEIDVTDQINAIIDDPKTARIDRTTRFLRARSVGETTVSFYLDNREIQTIPLTVLEPTMPETLRLDPEELTLGIGTTRRLMLIGQYDDKRMIDLTEVARWKPNDSPIVSNVLGLLEGLEEGKTEIAASYAVDKNIPVLNASCKVEVVPENYTAIEIRGVPERLYEGFSSVIEVVTKNEKGEERLLTRSPRLRFSVEPPEAAFIENGNLLTALTSGKAKFRAMYDTISAEVLKCSVDFEVVRDETASHFLVRPEEMKLIVGETALLDILPRGPDAVFAVCKDDSVVELIDDNQAVARKPGKTSILVSQGSVQKEIPVEISEGDWQSIAFLPDQIFVAVDCMAPLRLVGTDKSGMKRDIALDQIVWETEPDPEFVQLDPFSLSVCGTKPTEENQPQTVKARCNDRTAEARIEVLPAPLRLELSPSGPIDLPVDQQIKFIARADYGAGATEIAPDRIQWNIAPASLPEGVVWDPLQGVLKAEKPGIGPIEITATYQGETSKSCQTKTCESAPIVINFAVDKPSLLIGEQGNVLITPKDASSPCSPIPEKYSFISSESKLLNVDPKTGQYIGMLPGKCEIVVSHPAVKGENSAPITVEESNKPRLVLRPDNITLNVGETAAVSLIKIDGDQEEIIPFIQSGKSLLMTTNPDASRIIPPNRIRGVRPAPPFQVFARYDGLLATATIEVNPRTPTKRPPRSYSSSPSKKAKPNRRSSGGYLGDSSGGSGEGYAENGDSNGGDSNGGDGDGSDCGNCGNCANCKKKRNATTWTGSEEEEEKKEKKSRKPLVLRGPNRITVDTKAFYTATLNGRDVTFDSTSLVVDQEAEKSVDVLSGLTLRGKKSGAINVRARHLNEVSDPIRVWVERKADKLERLELVIDQSPMVIGERRSYQLLGYPVAGGQRQDLTPAAVSDSDRDDDDSPRVSLVDVSGFAKADRIITHTPPYISAKSTGNFGLTATYRGCQSDKLELEVLGRTGGKALQVRPSSITVSAGELTPPITVSVESPLEPGRMIEVDAQFESIDEKILAPISGVFDQFRAGEVGETTIVVKAAGQETLVPVEVLDQPFHRVSLDRSANMLADGRFQVYIDVEAITKNKELEYRIAPLDEKDKQTWISLETDQNGRQWVRLVSPELQGGDVNERHHLIIEVYDKKTDSHQRHPIDFRIKGKSIEIEP